MSVKSHVPPRANEGDVQIDAPDEGVGVGSDDSPPECEPEGCADDDHGKGDGKGFGIVVCRGQDVTFGQK